MVNENIVIEIIKCTSELAQKVDTINKRITNALAISVIVFGLTICAITACYFFSDYQYPETTQITTDESTTQTIK